MIKKMFKYFDVDKDGVISEGELGNVMRQLGENPTEAEIKELIAEADTEKDGTIGLDEFMVLMGKKLKNTKEKEIDDIKRVFRLFDRDGNGRISAKEFRFSMKAMSESLSEQQIEDLMKEKGPMAGLYTGLTYSKTQASCVFIAGPPCTWSARPHPGRRDERGRLAPPRRACSRAKGQMQFCPER